jgi:DNA-binding CsgD family transcriptional regulator
MGAGTELVSELETLMASEPLHERLRGQLMLALYRSGRQADSLAIYRELSDLLRDELGLEPGRALQELERSILQHDASLHPPPGERIRLPRPPALSGHVRDPRVAAGRLLERELEMAAIGGLVEAALAGSGRLLVVDGPAGVGKTRLLEEAARTAGAADVGVLQARGSEFEAGIGFGVARQVLEPMLRASSPDKRRRLLDGVARVGARTLGMEDGESPADRFAAIHGLYWLCANRTELGPLLVVIDDVQWADSPSLAWIGYLGRRVVDLPLVLVLGLRSGDPGGERAELAQLVGDGGARRMRLGPLSSAAVGEIVRAQFDESADESFCAAVSGLSGGNPLFVHELLAAARQQGLAARDGSVSALELAAPAAVGTSVLARLRGLGAGPGALARAVAVLGTGAEVSLAARLADLDPAVAELTADRLAAAQILARSRPLEFFHPLIGSAVLDDIAPGARRLAHRRAAALLADEGERSLSRVAAHLLECGPAGDGCVVTWLGNAAREALDRGAPEIAARYVRRALAEPPAEADRAALLLTLGMAEWRAQEPDAIGHLEQALVAAGEDHLALVRASGRLARAYYVTDQTERAVAVLERAFAAVAEADAGLALGLEAWIVLTGMTDERTASTVLRRVDGLRDRLRMVADPPVVLLVVLSWHAAEVDVRPGEAQELAERALACEPYPPPLETAEALIAALGLVDCYDEVQRLCEDLLAAARRRGALQELVGISAWRAGASYERGELADAEADARWALELATGVHRIRAVADLIRVLIERNELEEADDVLEQCVDARVSRSVEMGRLVFARGRLRGAQGRLQEALDDFLECGRRYEHLGMSGRLVVTSRAEAALTHLAMGKNAEARELACEGLALARAFGQPRPLGISLRACGLVEGGDAGLELLGEAVKTLERSESPLELARALSDYGAALRRAGRRVQARAELERALDLAHRCGARRIAAQARAELIAAGARPRRDAITGRDALTASELRVARLAAEGLANREIAQALFITTKTAKGHLSRVYHKLAITRRGQLRDALRGPLENGRRDSAAGAIS